MPHRHLISSLPSIPLPSPMTIFIFTLLLLLAAYAAGLLGSLTGLGGGIIVIPVLTLLFGVDFHYAVGAGLVSSIATSSGSGAAYVKRGITNIRLGMFLEVATTIGAVCGAYIAIYLDNSTIAILFSLILLLTAFNQWRKKSDTPLTHGSKAAKALHLNGHYPHSDGTHTAYQLKHVGGGFSLMYIAGVLSGLLGIGSGVLKVMAMDDIMHVPFKVSTTTSNFMIGVTAVASAVVYFQRGYILPGIAFPILVGVLLGAITGAQLLRRINVSHLRRIFFFVILLTALNMLYNGIAGHF